MATLQKNILGQLSGTLGSTVVRNRNGKSVVYSLPRKYNPSDSDKLREARNKFGLTVKFAKFINSIPLLKQAWEQSIVEGSNSYQKIIKHNAGKNTSSVLTTRNLITPAGAPLHIKEADSDRTRIDLLLETNEDAAEIFVSPFIACAVICFFNPMNEDEIYYRLCGLNQMVEHDITGTEFSLTLLPDSVYIKYINQYSNLILYITFVKEHFITNKLIWTATAAKEIECN